MALSGLHVACGYIGGRGPVIGSVRSQVELTRPPVWSQTMASAGTTTQGAPTFSDSGEPSFEIRASLDVYVSVGPTPDATISPRIFIPANETRNIICSQGDKLAWVAA